MTLKNRVGHQKLANLAGNSQGKDELLLRAFGDGQKGLTPQRLCSIRQHGGPLYGRVRFAAEVLFESLLELEIPATDISAQFTLDNLAALVYEQWQNSAWHRENIRVEIRRRHKAEFAQRKIQFSFKDISYPQLFRETISHNGNSLYQGNLYESRSFWRNFQPSNEDFLSNISLPLRIGSVEALLLGIYWADGYLRKSSGSSLTLIIDGERSDLDAGKGINMYGDLVAPLLKNTHNFGPVSGDSYVEKRKTISGIEHHPSFEINSAAICTWLKDDLGYPSAQRTKGVYEQKRLPFEHLEGLDTRLGFFAGLVAGLGIVDADYNLLFEHRDKTFIEDIAKLSKMLGYSPSAVYFRYPKSHDPLTKSPIWYFALPKEDLGKMQQTDLDTSLPHRGLSFNPKHYRRFLDHAIQL